VIRGLITDDEWAYFEPFLIRQTGRPPRSHRRVLDAVFWQMRTGAPWRDLPGEEFGNWNSIFRQFRRWADSGYIITIADDDRASLDKICRKLVASDVSCDVMRNIRQQDRRGGPGNLDRGISGVTA
jgi:transposase